VEIVLGLEGRLFVVLPTGVNTALPFACNAPFVQDPARVKIKDPQISATNRWLLERAGRLAAQTMLSWLRRTDLAVSDRAAAYRLLPLSSGTHDSIEASCATIVTNKFYEAIRHQRFTLTESGRLVGTNECIAVPPWLSDVWDISHISEFFEVAQRPLFAREVGQAPRAELVRRGFLAELTLEKALEVLRDNHLPRPKNIAGLLTLWDAVAPRVASTQGQSLKAIRILLVKGQDRLYAAPSLHAAPVSTIVPSSTPTAVCLSFPPSVSST